jgi:hypothetical protein
VEGGRVEGDRVIVDPGGTETVLRKMPLEPDEQRDVTLHVEAPTGDPFSVTVVERVDGQDVGGNVYYYVPPGMEPTPSAGEGGPLVGGLLSDSRAVVGGIGLALCCAGIFIAAIVVGAVITLRRGHQPQVPPSY